MWGRSCWMEAEILKGLLRTVRLSTWALLSGVSKILYAKNANSCPPPSPSLPKARYAELGEWFEFQFFSMKIDADSLTLSSWLDTKAPWRTLGGSLRFMCCISTRPSLDVDPFFCSLWSYVDSAILGMWETQCWHFLHDRFAKLRFSKARHLGPRYKSQQTPIYFHCCHCALPPFSSLKVVMCCITFTQMASRQ